MPRQYGINVNDASDRLGVVANRGAIIRLSRSANYARRERSSKKAGRYQLALALGLGFMAGVNGEGNAEGDLPRGKRSSPQNE